VKLHGAPGWLSGLSDQLNFSSGHDLKGMGLSPALSSMLRSEFAGDSLSPSPSALPPRAHVHALSLK